MSADILTFRRQRTVAELLSQILIDQAKLDRLMRATTGREPTEVEDASWSALDDVLWENRKALRELVSSTLGVDAEALAGAIL